MGYLSDLSETLLPCVLTPIVYPYTPFNTPRHSNPNPNPNRLPTHPHRLSVVQSRVGELEVELEETEDRRRKANSGARTLRDSEDRFLREERLKDDLDIAKRQKLELEAALLDRDARAIENRFDLESKAGEAERMRRRIRELEQAYRAAAAAAGGAKLGNLDAAFAGPSQSKGGQRERDLEGVIDAMKRVVDKLKAENDRLKKGTGTDAAKGGEWEKKASAEKRRADKAEDDLKGMAAKLRGHEESSQKLVQKQEALTRLKKQLKQREDELAELREKASSGQGEEEKEVALLRKKLGQAEGRIQALEGSVQQAEARAARGAKAADKGDGRQARTAEQAAEVDSLRAGLQEAQRRIAELSSGTAAAAGGAAGAGAAGAGMAAELRSLREENKNLRQELSAFDLDFFEEIEDLKNAHAEAVKKLRMYEGGGRR